MTSDTLSQREIDRLFSGSGEPVEKPAPPETRTDVQVYDFRRPNRISKDRQRSLEAIYGMMAKSLEGWLTGRVRGQIDMRLVAVEQFTFGEFMLSLPNPCASYVFNIGDNGGPQAVIDFGRELAFFLVERFLGGNVGLAVQDRSLTVLERRVVRIAAERAASLLMDAWAEYADLDLRLSRFESIPDMLQATNKEDPVLVANIEIQTTSTESTLLVCLPFSALEKFFMSSGQGLRMRPLPRPEQEAERKMVEQRLRGAMVPVSVRFPVFRMSIAELNGLKAGEMVFTGVNKDVEAEVYVAGRRRFLAAPGRISAHMAARLTERVPDEEEDPS